MFVSFFPSFLCARRRRHLILIGPVMGTKMWEGRNARTFERLPLTSIYYMSPRIPSRFRYCASSNSSWTMIILKCSSQLT